MKYKERKNSKGMPVSKTRVTMSYGTMKVCNIQECSKQEALEAEKAFLELKPRIGANVIFTRVYHTEKAWTKLIVIVPDKNNSVENIVSIASIAQILHNQVHQLAQQAKVIENAIKNAIADLKPYE